MWLSACAPGSGSAEPTQTITPSPTASAITEVPPFRFAVIGDYGSGFATQHEVADRMCDWRRDHPFDDVITTGDNIYPDGAQEHFQRNFFGPYSCLLDR